MRAALSSVKNNDRTGVSGGGYDLIDRRLMSQDIGNMSDRDQSRLVRKSGVDPLLRKASVRLTFEEAEFCAGLSRDHLPGKEVGVVLHDRNNDLVSRLDMRKAVAVRDQIQALGRIPGKDDLFRMSGVDKFLRCDPRTLIVLSCRNA